MSSQSLSAAALSPRADYAPPQDAHFEHGQAEFFRSNHKAEQGVLSPANNCFSYVATTRSGPALSSYTRLVDSLRLLERLADRTARFPQERVTGITLIAGNSFFHRPVVNTEVRSYEIFLRSEMSKGDHQRDDPRRVRPKVQPSRAGMLVEAARVENERAFTGAVAQNGQGFALLEHVSHPSNERFNMSGIDNLTFCALQAEWDRAHSSSGRRVATSLTQPTGRFLPEIPAPVPLYSSLIRYRGAPTSGDSLAPFPELSSPNRWDVLTAQSRIENHEAEAGLMAPNGFFWTYAAMVGQPIFNDELTDEQVIPLGTQNERFLRILWEWAENNPTCEIRGSHYKKLVGPFLQDPRDRDNQDRSHQEVPMWECLLRGRDSSVPLPTRDREKAERSGGTRIYHPYFLDPEPVLGELQVSPPQSFASLMAWNQRRQNLPAEGLVPSEFENHLAVGSDHWLNRYGEGFCLFEFSEAPLEAHERSMAEQRYEVLKRLREWHVLSPFLEVTESHFWQGHFAEFMDSAIYSNQRNFVFRVRDFDWDSVPESERMRIAGRTADYELPSPQTAASAYTHRHLSAMKGAWAGIENDDGTGWAMIDFVVPFPSSGNPGVRDTNAQFVRLAAHWAETFWWREIVCTEVLREWSAHQQQESPEESFAYTLIINFKRRGTPEALKIDGVKAAADILNARRFPWDERYAELID